MISTIEVKGLDETLRKLRALPQAMQKHLVKAACDVAVAVIKDEAIRLAPEWTGPVSQGHPPPGTLKKAIYQARMAADCTPTLEVWKISVRKGNLAGKDGKDAYYASWVEFGHYARGATARNARERKALAAGTSVSAGAHYVLPNPFMRPAFEAKNAEAVRVMQQYVAANLPEVVRRT